MNNMLHNMITTPKEMYDKVAVDYRKSDNELDSTFFDFKVSMPKIDILETYRELQRDINGDDVEFPEDENSLLETYTGDCEPFLLSLNNKTGYSRINDGEKCVFIL